MLLCKTPTMLKQPYLALWPKCLEALVNLFELRKNVKEDDSHDVMVCVLTSLDTRTLMLEDTQISCLCFCYFLSFFSGSFGKGLQNRLRKIGICTGSEVRSYSEREGWPCLSRQKFSFSHAATSWQGIGFLELLAFSEE